MKIRFLLVVVVIFVRPLFAGAFSFDDVKSQARQLSAQPFQPVAGNIPKELQQLDYDHYQAIKFKHAGSLWHGQGLPFDIEFFIPGYLHKQQVLLHQLDVEQISPIAFDPASFEFPANSSALPSDLGYAGFRVVAPGLGFGEVAVFLDASYFRMIGRGQIFGASARGLSLNTIASEGEEFPAFREFWIRRPAKRDRELMVYALMDSPGVAGAYQFKIRPGDETVTVVQAALFPRRAIKEFGIAPLTSMFLFGEDGRPPFTDFRPEVHDSDGLLIHTGRDEWIWRPLDTGKMTRVNLFQDENPQGFGLLQRQRDYEQYKDLESGYEKRPNMWVKPLGNWGQGGVELIQIASDKEYTDNIAAFWKPATPPEPQAELPLNYEIHFAKVDPSPLALAHVTLSGMGRAIEDTNRLHFVIEFSGRIAASISRPEEVSAMVDHPLGVNFLPEVLIKNPINQSWRLVIEFTDPKRAVELRANLQRGGRPFTETWSFTWQP